MSSDNSEQKEQVPTETKEPNIIFVGKNRVTNKETGVLEFKRKTPPRSIRVVRRLIELPEAEIQRKGFYLSEANAVIAASRDYKAFSSEEQPEVDLPQSFPSREVFRKLGLDLEDVRLLNREALIALDDVGPKTADKVLEYLENYSEEVENNG